MHRVPMIFPGQASQFPGMALDIAGRGGAGADFLGRVDGILGESLSPIMYEGPKETLTETRNCQPAILAHSVAVVLDLAEMGIAPSLVAGHSLGEFSAAVAAGALQADDALRLVRLRGELMFRAGQEVPGTMAAVLGLDAGVVASVCEATDGIVVLANHNSEGQLAISGEVDAVAAASTALKEAGAKRVIPLPVSGAFHSPLLEGAREEFARHLAETEFADPKVPLIANVSARPVTTGEEIRDGMTRQLTAPVLWHASMVELIAAAPRTVVEAGPGRVLSNLARRAWPDTVFVPVGTVENLDSVLDNFPATG